MRAHQRDGVGDFHRGVLTLEGPARRRAQSTQVRGTGLLQRYGILEVRRAAGVTAIKRLDPGLPVRPPRGIVSGDRNRRDAVSIQAPELLRHALNDFKFLTKLVVLVPGPLSNQNRLRQIRRVDHDELGAQRRHAESQ